MQVVVGQPTKRGDEPEPLADVRGTDARSAQICRPDGVARTFQVSVNSVEPREAVRTRNLLANDDCRSAGGDEPKPDGPEVTIVGGATAATGGAEGLTGAAAGPNWNVVWPSSTPNGVGPDADAGEEMGLRGLDDVIGRQVADGAGVDGAGRDVAGGDEVGNPRGWIGFDLIVERGHQGRLPSMAV